MNMELSELRVGNRVNYNGKEVIITPALFSDLLLNPIRLKNLKPIKLNKDWLTLLGGDWEGDWESSDEENYSYEFQKFVIYTKNNEYYLGHFDTPVKYVHHLQNIGFVINGSELDYNEQYLL